MIRLIIFILLVLALDFYALQSFRSVVRNPWITYGYVIVSLIVLGNIVYQGVTFDRGSGVNSGFYLSFALFVLVYVPKLVLLVFIPSKINMASGLTMPTTETRINICYWVDCDIRFSRFFTMA